MIEFGVLYNPKCEMVEDEKGLVFGKLYNPRMTLIEELFNAMRCEMAVMAEYGDDENALRKELETADSDILDAYADMYLD